MSNINKQLRQLAQIYQRDTNKTPPVGVLGTATGEIVDHSKPGNMWAREWSSGQYSTPRSYPNMLPDNTRIFAGMPVELGWKDGVQCITDKDRQGLIAAGVNPATIPSPFTSQQSITTFLVQPTNPASMFVQVLGGKSVINGITYTAPTTDETTHVNLTSIEAGLAADEHCYAVVYVLLDYSGYEVFASTGKSTLLSLKDSDLDECHALASTGSTALAGVRVYEGMTSVTAADVFTLGTDIRPFFNALRTYRYTPSSTADTFGAVDDKAWDDNYEYRKTNAGWKRTALSTF